MLPTTRTPTTATTPQMAACTNVALEPLKRWCSSPPSRAYPTTVPQTAANGQFPQPSLDEVIVFNRSHLNLFQRDPHYRDIFTLANCFSPRALIL